MCPDFLLDRHLIFHIPPPPPNVTGAESSAPYKASLFPPRLQSLPILPVIACLRRALRWAALLLFSSFLLSTLRGSILIMPSRAAAQGGLLKGSNPSTYDPKNPIIVFIIQVCLATVAVLQAHRTDAPWNRLALSSSSIASSISTLQDTATTSHCRSHWWNLTRPISPRSCPKLQQCDLPRSFHTHPHNGRKRGPDPHPLPRWARGGSPPACLKLADCT